MLPRGFICSRLFPYTSVCPHMLPDVLGCSQTSEMLSDAPIYVRMLSYAVRCSQALPYAFICLQMLLDAPGCPQILSYHFKYFQIPPHPFKCRGAGCFLPLWVRGRVVCRMSCQVGHCAPVRARKHFACKSSQIRPDAPQCSHMLPYALICYHVPSDALTCSQMLSDVPKCSQTPSYAFRCFQMPPDALRYFHVPSDAFRCSQILSDALRCSQVPSDAPI